MGIGLDWYPKICGMEMSYMIMMRLATSTVIRERWFKIVGPFHGMGLRAGAGAFRVFLDALFALEFIGVMI